MVKVTEANLTYLPEIYELEQSLFLQNAYSLKTLKEELLNENRVYLVGLNKQNVMVGYVGVNLVSNVAEIMKIGVAKQLQGKGVGKVLLTEMEKTLKEKGVTEFLLEVNEKNLPAINLYEKCGFKKISTRKNYYASGNALIYAKKLV